jgi:hypothetical protein
MSLLPRETMRSAIHRCLAILLVSYICVSSANAQVAGEPCGWPIVILQLRGMKRCYILSPG